MRKELLEKFYTETKRSFKFLEADYGYKLISAGMENENYYPDTISVVRYLGKKIGVEIYWYFASAVIGVAITEVTRENQFPPEKRFWGKSRGEARAINLHTFADMLGKSDLFILKKLRSTKMSDVKKRGKVINENLRGVLENLAEILQAEAKDILLGDTTIFSAVQELELESQKKIHPYWKNW